MTGMAAITVNDRIALARPVLTPYLVARRFPYLAPSLLQFC